MGRSVIRAVTEKRETQTQTFRVFAVPWQAIHTCLRLAVPISRWHTV